MKEMVRRQKAVVATKGRFEGKAFAWGSVDCAKMAAFHLKQMGHKVRLSKAGQYTTALGAQAACRRMGGETLPEVMDALGFPRIAPAFAKMGDIVSFQSDHPIGALGIIVGNGNMMAFHESHDLPVIMSMNLIDAAWDIG